MGKIFISYRRQDSAGHAGRLYDRLSRRFGGSVVFRDVDGIAPGENFVDVLKTNVSEASVMLVIIGHDWLTIAGTYGRRLDDPKDFVRLEVEMALAEKIPAIPILVEDAPMPGADQLPASIKELAYSNALKLSEDTFDYECDQLENRLQQILGKDPAAASKAYIKWAAIAAAVIVAVALVWMLLPKQPTANANTTKAEDTTAVSSTVRAARELMSMKDYPGAWKMVSASSDAAAKEDVGMAWLRDVRVPEGHTFAEVVDQVSPTLAAGVDQATGARKADLLAHLGWGTFLRSRDGVGGLDAEPFYKRALAADAKNPFANIMLAHWMLTRPYSDPPMEEVRRLFAAALSSGRERAFVRQWQLAGLEYTATLPREQEYLRVANEIRASKEEVPARVVSFASSLYYSALNPTPAHDAVVAALSPQEHLGLLQWLDSERPSDATKVWMAAMQEAAGDPRGALATYQGLAAKMSKEDSGLVPDAVRAGIRRLRR